MTSYVTCGSIHIPTTTCRNRDGSTVHYLRLAHNERDPQTGVPRVRILYTTVHEVSIADALLREAAAAAARAGVTTVHAVGVRVGRSSGVALHALAMAFEILREGPLGLAVLAVEEAEGAGLCLAWIEGE